MQDWFLLQKLMHNIEHVNDHNLLDASILLHGL